MNLDFTLPRLARYTVLLSLLSSFIAFTAKSQPKAIIDSTFADNGWLISPWAKQKVTTNSMLVQPDGKFVIAGRQNLSDVVSSFCVMRMLKDGTPDTDFGEEGIVITPIDSFFDNGRHVVIDDNSNLYVGGSTGVGEESDWVIVKYLPNGLLDESFGEKGKLRGSRSGYDYVAKLGLIDNAPVAIVNAVVDDQTDFLVLKFDTEGNLDKSFGNDGTTIVDLGGNDYSSDMEIDADGNIIIGGSTATELVWNSFFVKLNNKGELDKSFSDDGMLIHSMSVHGNQLRDVLLLDDGSILAVGNAYDENRDQDFAITKLNADGTANANFGDNGISITKVSDGFDATQNAMVFEDGSILVCGYTWQEGGDYKLTSYNSNGILDQSFGTKGVRTLDYNQADEVPLNMVKAPNNSIYILGGFFSGNQNIPILLKLLSGYEVSISPVRSHSIASVFPNPAKENVRIDLGESRITNAKIQLLDLSGREIANSEIKNMHNGVLQYQLPAELSRGLYHAIIISENQVWTAQLVKE